MKPKVIFLAAAITCIRAKTLHVRDINTPFPDDQLSCSIFPSAYGAVATHWLYQDGWNGIQAGSSGIRCDAGSYCSYACPAGYQKSQWSDQINPADGHLPFGGLYCSADGRLVRSNRRYSSLCIKGTTAVTVNVNNRGSSDAALCRTDVPGTEEPTIPLLSTAGSTIPLTIPDSSYPAAAYYFLNPRGVPVDEACSWGDASQPQGNWAPLIVGADFSDGTAFISMAMNPVFVESNAPSASLGYTVEISGASGTCKYANGVLSCSNSACPNGPAGTPFCMTTIPSSASAQLILS